MEHGTTIHQIIMKIQVGDSMGDEEIKQAISEGLYSKENPDELEQGDEMNDDMKNQIEEMEKKLEEAKEELSEKLESDDVEKIDL